MSERRTTSRQWREFRSGDVIRDTFTLYFRHFGAIMGVTLMVFLPTLIPSALAVAGAFGESDLKYFQTLTTVSLVASLVQFLIIQPLANAILCLALFHALQDRPITMRQSAAAGLRRVPAVLGVLICQAGIFLAFTLGVVIVGAAAGGIIGAAGGGRDAGILVGILVGIVSLWPGLWILIGMCVAVPATVVERVGPSASVVRSFALCRGLRMRLLLVSIVVWSVPVVLGFAVGVIQAVMQAKNPTQSMCFGIVSQDVLSLFTTSLGAVLMTVCYYHLRCAKEGLDVEALASAFDEESPAQ